MATDRLARPSRRDEDEPLTTQHPIDHVVFLTDLAETTVELWLRENDELHRVAIPWVLTRDLPAIRRFMERLGVPTETIDNS